MRSKKIFFSVFLILLFFSGVGQITFTRSAYLDVNGYGAVHSIIETPDNGYLLGGISSAFVAKLDSVGNFLWKKSYVDASIECVRSTPDSGYIFTGFTGNVSYYFDNELTCTKLNSAGDTTWVTNIDYGNVGIYGRYASGYDVIPTNDKGFAVCGVVSGNAWTMSVVKLDSLGNVQWTKVVSQSYPNNSSSLRPGSIRQTADSGYIVTASYGNIFKLSHMGTFLWAKKYDFSPSLIAGTDIAVLPYGFLFCMVSDKIALIKSDNNGNVLWNRSYSMPLSYPLPNPYKRPRLHILSNGDYAFSWGSNFVITDSSGNVKTVKNLPDITDFIETHDKGFCFVGNGFNHLGSFFSITKTDSLCNGSGCFQTPVSVSDSTPVINVTIQNDTVTSAGIQEKWSRIIDTTPLTLDSMCVVFVGVGIEEHTVADEISIFPNPSNGTFKISFSNFLQNELLRLELVNELGEKIFQSSHSVNSISETDTGPLTEGCYFLKFIFRNKILVKKIIVAGQ